MVKDCLDNRSTRLSEHDSDKFWCWNIYMQSWCNPNEVYSCTMFPSIGCSVNLLFSRVNAIGATQRNVIGGWRHLISNNSNMESRPRTVGQRCSDGCHRERFYFSNKMLWLASFVFLSFCFLACFWVCASANRRKSQNGLFICLFICLFIPPNVLEVHRVSFGIPLKRKSLL